MELDISYKFIISCFAIAYFIGLVIGIIIVSFNIGNYQESDITRSFYLTGQTSFKELFTENINITLKQTILPFSFISIAIKNGFNHSTYILSPFLGQIKLATLLIPDVFYFIAYILMSAIGLKILITIIIYIVNKIKNKKIIKIKLLKEQDALFIYLALLSITIGTFIQIYLSRIFFIFLINYQLITYILIIIVYTAIISFSLYILYKIIKSVMDNTFINNL